MSRQRRVILWSHPRACATVFTRCIGQISDVVFYEPYAVATSFGPEARRKFLPAENHSKRRCEAYTFNYVKNMLEEDHESSVIFVKDQVYAIAWNLGLLPDHYQHTFLIRNPSDALKSYFRATMADMSTGDIDTAVRAFRNRLDQHPFYKEVYEAVKHCRDILNQDPVIIDADDLLKYPLAIIEKYCSATELPYFENMLQWPSLNEPPENWKYPDVLLDLINAWFKDALHSTGFNVGEKRQKSNRNDKIEIPEEIMTYVKEADVYYKKLWAMRLKI